MVCYLPTLFILHDKLLDKYYVSSIIISQHQFWLQVTVINWLCLKHRWKRQRKSRASAAMRTSSTAFSVLHRCGLRNSLAQVETDPLGVNCGHRGRWHARQWVTAGLAGQSGTMFRVNLSAFRILAPIEAMFKTDGYTATMATGVDLASFFPHQLGCAQGVEINFCILR